jgi:predicted acylesterase/phospholipase RssA
MVTEMRGMMVIMTTSAPTKLPQKTRAWFAGPGAGSALGVVNGAMASLWHWFEFLGFGGTSGGGLDALAYAFGLSPAEVRAELAKFLVRKDLLDVSFFGGGTGLFRGQKIENCIKDIFGEKLRMGDLKYPARVSVADLWTRHIAIVDSVRHADIEVWRAARATMAIERFFDAVRLRPDNARLYGDGGVGLNVPAGMWDDKPEPTVVVRFARQQPVHTLERLMANADGGANAADVRRVTTGPGVTVAAFDLLMDAASAAFPSRKTGNFEIVLPDHFDALKFGLAPEETTAREHAGMTAAAQQMRALTA